MPLCYVWLVPLVPRRWFRIPRTSQTVVSCHVGTGNQTLVPWRAASARNYKATNWNIVFTYAQYRVLWRGQWKDYHLTVILGIPKYNQHENYYPCKMLHDISVLWDHIWISGVQVYMQTKNCIHKKKKNSHSRPRKRIKLIVLLAFPLYRPSLFCTFSTIVVTRNCYKENKLPGVWHQFYCSSICCPSRCSLWNGKSPRRRQKLMPHDTRSVCRSQKKKKKSNLKNFYVTTT